MDYNLAKKLKNAGYPQEGLRFCKHDLEPFDGAHFMRGWKTTDPEGYCDSEYVIKPILSELIAACGRNLVSLKQIPTINPIGNEPDEAYFNAEKKYLKENRWFWSATWFTGSAENIVVNEVGGLTPEIAVANLWLALKVEKKP